MKTVLTFLLLLSLPAAGQNLDTAEQFEAEDIRLLEEEEMSQEEVLPEEELMPERTSQACPCPPSVQAGEALSDAIPADAVFLIAPEPAPAPAVQEEVKPQADLPPGYGGQLPAGYSDGTYKQIQ